MARIVVCMIVASRLLLSQAAPSFEVASVKVSDSTRPPSVDSDPGSLAIDGTLNFILRWAYDIKDYQLSGSPALRTTRYHVAAKTIAPSSPSEIKLMLQRLLAERLKLAVHHESKELAVYALVVSKDGPKLKESGTEGESVTKNNPKPGTGGTSVRTSMSQLADLLEGACPDPVVDQTGLKGRYDFTLDFASYLVGIQPGDLPAILNEAMQKQIGINLEHKKITIDLLIVDHVEKTPIEN
jgi:uncharacterized protein (TIGR03435 family)